MIKGGTYIRLIKGSVKLAAAITPGDKRKNSHRMLKERGGRECGTGRKAPPLQFFSSETCLELRGQEFKKTLRNMRVCLRNYENNKNYTFQKNPNS